MGGFEGGDEGGFWDDDGSVSYIDKHKNKKRKKKKENRVFIQKEDFTSSIKLYTREKKDCGTLSFIVLPCKVLTIEGYNDTSLVYKSIFQAYNALDDLDVIDYFDEHKIVLTESDSLNLEHTTSIVAAFFYLCKESCNLILSPLELLDMANTIDEDIGFFLNNYYEQS